MAARGRGAFTASGRVGHERPTSGPTTGMRTHAPGAVPGTQGAELFQVGVFGACESRTGQLPACRRQGMPGLTLPGKITHWTENIDKHSQLLPVLCRHPRNAVACYWRCTACARLRRHRPVAPWLCSFEVRARGQQRHWSAPLRHPSLREIVETADGQEAACGQPCVSRSMVPFPAVPGAAERRINSQ
jgi:hypothetical protein